MRIVMINREIKIALYRCKWNLKKKKTAFVRMSALRRRCHYTLVKLPMHYSRDDPTDFVLLWTSSSYYSRKEIILAMLTHRHVEFNLSAGRSSTWEYILYLFNVYLAFFCHCTHIKYNCYKLLQFIIITILSITKFCARWNHLMKNIII